MRALQTGLGTCLLVALTAFAGACTLASPTYITSETGAPGADGGKGAASTSESTVTPENGGQLGGQCGTDDFVTPDLSKLTACGDGKGHCFDKAKTPIGDQLVACPGSAADVCVPDEILKAGGQKLKSCTSIIGPGGCVTASLIPEVAKQGGSALTRDVCDANQLCLPCNDPTNGNAPTPFCQPIGVHENACTGGAAGGGADAGSATAAQPCCTTKGKSNGICIAESAIPEAQRGDTKQDSCADGNKCVPAAFVSGNPVKCDSGILGAGVCLDKCFDSMMAAAGAIGVLSSDGCASNTELCVPCTFLSGQGAPGCE